MARETRFRTRSTAPNARAGQLVAGVADLDVDDEAYDQFLDVVARLVAAIEYCQDPAGHPDPAADGPMLIDIDAVFKAGRPFDHEPPIAREYRQPRQ